MKLPRLFVETPLAAASHPALSREQAHYIRNVLRLKAGDGLLVFNGADGEWEARITALGRHEVTLELARQTRPQADEPGSILLFAPIRRNRMEWMLEKATELGATRLVPVLTEHGVVEPGRPERLRARVVEAAEQCERLSVPRLDEPLPLLEAVDRHADAAVLFADERAAADPAAAPPVAQLAPGSGQEVLLVGPEGGFSAAERTALRSRAFVRPVSLGPRILRAETAALAMLACRAALLDAQGSGAGGH